jgi:ribosomal protein S8
MLSRIRNANSVGLEKVFVPYTKINLSITEILRDEGFVNSFEKITKYGVIQYLQHNRILLMICIPTNEF